MAKRRCVTSLLLLIFPVTALTDSVPNGFGKESCKLPDLDPWDPRMMSLLDTGYNPMRHCTSKFKAYTRLVSGSVLVDSAALPDGSYCKFRCLYPVDDNNYREGAWNNPEADKPDCDVVETNCWKENHTSPFLKDIHLQIYKKKDSSPKLPPTAPSVYWLVIDGVSTPQLIRSLPKTMHLLREDYGAIIFHHLNKIALNTPPNSRAMLLGKQMYDVIRFIRFDAYEKWEHTPILGDWERGEAYGHDIIQSILHWVTGWMDWNIALDEKGGPNWVGNNVDAPIIVNNTENEFYKQPMFYYLGHFSKLVRPGSTRILSSIVDAANVTSGYLEGVAFTTPKRQRVLVLHNRHPNNTYEVAVEDSIIPGSAKVTMEPKSIRTLVWNKPSTRAASLLKRSSIV